ncbi:MAG: hypothetical protein KF863_16990 [Rubrivivax sp.]|nr:hypothetical protein [Rubrivivax sp.]
MLIDNECRLVRSAGSRASEERVDGVGMAAFSRVRSAFHSTAFGSESDAKQRAWRWSIS